MSFFPLGTNALHRVGICTGIMETWNAIPHVSSPGGLGSGRHGTARHAGSGRVGVGCSVAGAASNDPWLIPFPGCRRGAVQRSSPLPVSYHALIERTLRTKIVENFLTYLILFPFYSEAHATEISLFLSYAPLIVVTRMGSGAVSCLL